MSETRARYGSPTSITFWVEGTPRPKQSFRYVEGGGYTSARIKAWQDTVGWMARQEYGSEEPMTGELKAVLMFYLPDKRRRDLDNLSKAVLDACEGIVYHDDNQIVDKHTMKSYSKDYSGVRVKVEQT